MRDIALLAAKRSALEAGIDNDPTVKAALEALRSGAPDLAVHRANLIPVVQELERNMEATHKGVQVIVSDSSAQSKGSRTTYYRTTGLEKSLKANQGYNAGYAVRDALLSDPLMAALQAVDHASRTVSDKDSLFRDVLLLAIQPSG